MPAKAKAQLYTVIIVSDHSQAVRKYRVRRSWLFGGFVTIGAGALALLIGSGHYASLLGTRSENQVLAEENAQLRSQLLLVQEKVAHISATLERVERFDGKLRDAATQLQDPQRNLAIGPVGRADEAAIPAATPPARPAATTGTRESGTALAGRLASLEGEAARQASSLQEVQAYFDDQKSLVASTPSTWPTRGWVTSDFGVRLDPYTAERMMHRGLDIATPHGQSVYTPSDGTVVFSGTENGYGKVLVIDHGYGVTTRYGHLSDVYVKLGDRVKRGARVAAVGNTGRSTGPHLHYEVRINGIPENPRKFILE